MNINNIPANKQTKKYGNFQVFFSCPLWWTFSKTKIGFLFSFHYIYYYDLKKFSTTLGRKDVGHFPSLGEKKTIKKRKKYLTKNFKEKHCWPIIQPRHFARRVSFFYRRISQPPSLYFYQPFKFKANIASATATARITIEKHTHTYCGQQYVFIIPSEKQLYHPFYITYAGVYQRKAIFVFFVRFERVIH